MAKFQEADTTYHSSEADTEVFSDSEELNISFQEDYMCAICKRLNPLADALKEAHMTDNASFLLVNNVVFLYCIECKCFFHLRCISPNLTTNDLLDIIETSYVCTSCQ